MLHPCHCSFRQLVKVFLAIFFHPFQIDGGPYFTLKFVTGWNYVTLRCSHLKWVVEVLIENVLIDTDDFDQSTNLERVLVFTFILET